MKTFKKNQSICVIALLMSMLFSASCSNEDTMGKDIPYAGFEMSSTSAQTEDTVRFSNITTGGSGSYTYAWNFGDGTFQKKPTLSTYIWKKACIQCHWK